MNAAVLARIVPFFLVFPLAGLPVRLVAGLIFAAVLTTRVTSDATPTLPALLAEAALGAALGVFAGLPIHAARGLRGDGPAALGLAGRVWAWAIFFAAGGPGLLLGFLRRSFEALPATAWPDAARVGELGGLAFYGTLVFGLPAFLATLLVEPAAAFVDRVAGAPLLTVGGVGVRGALLPLALLLAAPWLVDELRGLFTFTLE